MASIESIKTDSNLEINGVWVEWGGIDWLVARAGNLNYCEAMRNLVEPIKKEIREDKTTVDDFAELLILARSKTVLIGWKNLTDKAGVEIVYSSDKAAEFFRDQELHDLYKFVVSVSEDSARYAKEVSEESVKN